MSRCVVKHCSSSTRKRCPNVILHTFPREPEKIKLWLYLTGQYGADLDDMVIKVYLGKVNDSYRMCSLHFTHDSYNYDGYRRTLKRDSIPTVFNIITPSTDTSSVSSTIPVVSKPSSSSGEQQIPSAPSADSQKSSSSGTVCTYQVQFNPNASSQPTIQQMTLVPVVPQKVFLQACGISQQPNSVVSVTSPSVTIQPIETTMCKATQMHSALSGVSQQSPASSPSTLAPMTIPLCITQSKSAVSSYDGQLEQLTPANLQQISSATVTFLQKPSSVAPNSNLPLDTKLRIEATSSSTKTVFSTLTSCPKISLSPALSPVISTAAFNKTQNAQPINIPLTVRETKPCSMTVLPISKAPSSTTSSCPIISLFQAPNHVISTSGVDKSSYKNMTTPPNSIALAIVHETKPCSRTVLPVSENMSSVTQQPPTTTVLAQKSHPISVVHFPDKAPTSQTVIPDFLPPSKKRKLETSAASSGKIHVPNPCISQPSVNAGNHYFVSNNSRVQTNCVTEKPLMVDKGVNTDFLTNRKSCCVGTYPMHRRRNAGTQTKIYTKHRKIMCTLLVPNEETDDSSVTKDNPEDTEFNEPSPSNLSNGHHDLSEDLETVNLNLVKVEIVSNSEVDAYVPTASDIEQEFHIKEEIGTCAVQTHFKSNSTIPDFGINTLKKEPNIKTEDEQFPISMFSQDTTHFVSQNPKIERISPIPCDSLTAIYRNPTSWETSAIQTDDELGDPNDSSFHINELSEDEDESFLVPSDAEDEDDIKHVFQDLDSPVENLVEEEKYIVFESCLKKLIMMIPCRSETKCMSPLTQYKKETVGSYLSVEARCSSGHTSLLWESQPRHGYEPLGNVLLSAAVLFSGSSFVKSQHMFKLLNLKSIDKTTYSRNQSMYLFPAISHHWKEEQKAVIQSVQEMPLCLSGDQQLDSPGFSANYSTYSLMDVASKKICSLSVEAVTPQMTLEGLEKIGLQKTMEELQTMNADVKMIVTDRSIAVQEILKDSYPDIVHKIDLWHLSRSIGNEVLMAAKHKDCEILYQWVEAIRNHLWWSLCTCCKNPDLLIQKWKSVIHHVTNVHEWDGDGDCRGCHHPPLPEEVVNNTNWLEKDSAAHKQLKKIVENTSLLKDLKQLSFNCHTGELEIYHKTCLKYHPKKVHFFMDSMEARTQLAALDHNRNVHIVKEMVRKASSGEAHSRLMQRLEGSRGQKLWIVKALYKPACQNFLFDILNDVIAFVKEDKTFW
ncbi:uncharacterized protein LOC130276955 [Hyla sarda]|uniref:uncharacterized protein LOC130276955 n=1 Tax=Hyla sarda TaxID=327740 RepID=UPI0024C36313|nr:uncharacterized protein LOC130276955 [Hyla sarda]